LAAVLKKKRIRINYRRLLLTLLFISLIAYGVRMLFTGLYEASRADREPSGQGEEIGGVAATDTQGDNAESDDNPFAASYCYEAERQGRYETYAASHAGLTPNEVVWRVDAELDRIAYTNIVTVTDFTPPVLLNKRRKLPDDYVPQNLVNTSSGQQMTQETKAAYEAMRDDAGAAGRRISASSAYKSIEYQKGVYNKYVIEYGREAADSFSARAGHSEHHLGTAVDLVGIAETTDAFAGTPEAEWVTENAWKYGFIVRYTSENQDVTGYTPEPWHITWVGADAATTMREHGIRSLEEYVVKYVTHKPKND
jgi:D-alanyl-D-alanine carboxypeptidase